MVNPGAAGSARAFVELFALRQAQERPDDSNPSAGRQGSCAAKLPTLKSYGDGAAIVKVPLVAQAGEAYEEGNLATLGTGT